MGTVAVTVSRLGSSCTSRARSPPRSEEHTSELQSHSELVCCLLLEKKVLVFDRGNGFAIVAFDPVAFVLFFGWNLSSFDIRGAPMPAARGQPTVQTASREYADCDGR